MFPLKRYRVFCQRSDHTNTGVLTALMPVLDIDIKDAAAAEAAERLVRDRFAIAGRFLSASGARRSERSRFRPRRRSRRLPSTS